MVVEHHVYFAVFGFDEDPQEVTLLAGEEPDEVWRRGESFSAAFPEARRRENRWILASGLDEQASPRDHFEKLLLRLEGLGDNLEQLLRRYRCGVGVSRYYFMDDPGFYLPDHLLERYDALGVPVTFDQIALDGATTEQAHGNGN